MDVSLIDSANKGHLLLVMDGLLQYQVTPAGLIKIDLILVLPFRRRTGVGRNLIAALRDEWPGRTIVAGSFTGCPSTPFWEALGFKTRPGMNGRTMWILEGAQ